MRLKKVMMGAAALCLTAAVAIGGTLAYLSVETASRANNFTFVGTGSEGLDAELTEPEWDKVYGENDYPKNLTPGAVIKKDPTITNIGAVDEWVGIKLTFCYGPDATGGKAGKKLSTADLAKVLAAVTIDWNSESGDKSWVRYKETAGAATDSAADLEQTFYYNKKLTAKAVDGTQKTTPLFNTVTIKDDNTNEEMNELAAMGGFQIHVQGCAVTDDAFTAIDGTNAQNFTFAKTPAGA